MSHISDSQFNEYLDHVLDEATQRKCDLHLTVCAECRGRLAELQSVYYSLAQMHEIKLARDLRPSVMANLPRAQSQIWTPFFATQLGAALGVFLFAAIQAAQAIRIPSLPAFQFSMPEIRFVTLNFQPPIPYSPLAGPNLSSIFAYPPFRLLQLSASRFALSNFQTFIIAIATLLLWFVANIILLRERSEGRE